MSMFCYQCEQTAGGKGCRVGGVCGKDPQTALMQDKLIYALKGISMYAHRAGELGVRDHEIDHFVIKALFATLTNVNFDVSRFENLLEEADRLRDKIEAEYQAKCPHAEAFTPADGFGIENRLASQGPDVTGLQELLTYGLKGLAAYADHAQILGNEDDAVYAYLHEALNFLASNPGDIAELTAQCLKCGEVNLEVMALLDKAHTTAFGSPEPTSVRVTPVKGKAILVSGHDLKDLHELLKQTEGLGINVYTHGEMLPACAYPVLKKYSHLAGNYGGAWQDQQKEFDAFPGPILMTTNCIVKPRQTYKARIFTTGLAGFPGVRHLTDQQFAPIIESAKASDGFTQDEAEKRITIGFAHDAVMGVADKVIEAVKAGDIRHFFLIGGCDGAKSGRNYYTDLAQMIPDDCVILTLACGKYRFNKLEFGDIGGIPRLLDVGQCNDAYSAIQIASALAGAFGTDVNHLPLSIVLSWFEQKAVVILLTLLSLGIQNMRIGPSLPAFISPAVLGVLVEKFNIKPIGDPKEDLADMLRP